ncbi:hypothetical protein [Lonepinella sp. BR2474]|uniref:hypothetical protein n=1 Tax=Lonepinella sp. BR2474 TaxID=3434548 RepID=UPI003F6DD113
MKKLTAIALAFISTTVWAATENKGTVPTPKLSPTANIFVLDVSGKTPKLLPGNQLSRSKPRHLCVAISNVDIQEQNRFIEYILAPEPMTMISQGSEIKIDEDKKGFLITTSVKKSDVKNNVVSRCWRFDKNDPVGKYKLDAQFNNIVFKNLSFEVLK